MRFSGFSNGKSKARMIGDSLFFAVCSILARKDMLEHRSLLVC